MELREAIAVRRSIRAFSPEQIPTATVEEIMAMALRAPSWGNTQPWKFTIVTGSVLEKIKEEFVRLAQRGVPSNPDIPFPTSFNQTETARYKELGKDLFEALGIPREDREKRKAHFLDMTRFFGAPCIIYLHFSRGFNTYALLDAGLILQTIALLAVDHRLGTCILTRSISYPDVVRKHAGITPDQVLVMGMCIGIPIHDHPANRFRSKRGKAKEFLRFVDIG